MKTAFGKFTVVNSLSVTPSQTLWEYAKPSSDQDPLKPKQQEVFCH